MLLRIETTVLLYFLTPMNINFGSQEWVKMMLHLIELYLNNHMQVFYSNHRTHLLGLLINMKTLSLHYIKHNLRQVDLELLGLITQNLQKVTLVYQD
ncbi:MAG: hypothetical protein CMK81_00160 [Pseudomonadales bacterium]|nr:hypothetical protein [Pseudomonadales bacterium]